jgi:carboxyl-terminal processing protease
MSRYVIILAALSLLAPLDGRPPKQTASKKIVKTTAQKQVSAKPAVDPEQEIYQWFRTCAEIVSTIKDKALRNVEYKNFFNRAFGAAASEIDSHSAFLNADSYKAAIESASGEFSGIGISIVSKPTEDDSLGIIDVVSGGPAEKAGIKAGDKIVEIASKKLRGLSSDEVINLLKGPIGSSLKIKTIRNKKPMEFDVTRDLIKDQASLCYRFNEQNIYYLSLKIFSNSVADQIGSLLKKANTGQCKGIVLDLRRNPGGVLESAIEMASLFLKKRSLVATTKNKHGDVVNKYYTAQEPILTSDTPIIILIDNFTASAGEILAGSLQYHAMQDNAGGKPLMVFLVGTTTFGKGSVQEVIPITNGCALKLTTMLYYLPGDTSIQATGIAPDFVVKPKTAPAEELKWVQEMYGQEKSLKNHITPEEAAGKPKPTAAEEEAKKAASSAKDGQAETTASIEEKQKEAIGQDNQVQAAVNMINLLTLAKKAQPKSVATRKSALSFLKEHFMSDDTTELVKITG